MARQITLTLDDEVAERLERAAEQSRRPVEDVASEMLRKAPLPPPESIEPKPFKVRARDMGGRADADFTCVWKLLDELEGPGWK